jgi:FtsH-binding integral membrane protein
LGGHFISLTFDNQNHLKKVYSTTGLELFLLVLVACWFECFAVFVGYISSKTSAYRLACEILICHFVFIVFETLNEGLGSNPRLSTT